MSKKIKFTKISITEFVIAVLIISTLLFFVFGVFYKSAVANNSKMIEAALSHQVANDELSLRNYVGLSVNISENPDVLLLMQEGVYDFETALDVEFFLKQHKSLLPEISDIFLYNAENGNLFNSFGTTKSVNDFTDTATLTELNKEALERKQSVLNPPDSRINGNTGNISYIFSSIKTLNDAIIISISEDKIRSAYSTLSSKLMQPLIITDTDGNVIFGGDSYVFGQNISNEKFFPKNNTSSGISENYNGEKVFFNYVYSESCDRIYITATPSKNIIINSIFNKSFALSTIITLIAALLLLAFLKWLFGLKKEIFRYIESIKNNWNNQATKNNGSTDLFEYIRNPHSEKSDDTKIYLPPGLTGDEFGIIRVHLDSKDTSLTANDFDLYRYGINNICAELLNESAYCYAIHEDYNSLTYIIGNTSHTRYAETTFSAAQLCIKKVLEYAEFELSFFISSLYSFENIYYAYSEVKMLSEYKFLHGSGCILYPSDLREKNKQKLSYCFDLCSDINNSIINNKNDATSLFTKLKDMLIDMDISDAKDILQHLHIYLQTSSNALIKRNIITSVVDCDQLLLQMKSAPDFPAFCLAFTKFCDLLSSERDTANTGKHGILVNKIISIIKEEYKNELLCVEYIAERTGFSVNHLRKIFKQSEGISISDKITDIRLEEAERLLSGTNKKVTDIMAEVGFSNNSYFAVLFKKKYGTTPSVYRSSGK